MVIWRISLRNQLKFTRLKRWLPRFTLQAANSINCLNIFLWTFCGVQAFFWPFDFADSGDLCRCGDAADFFSPENGLMRKIDGDPADADGHRDPKNYPYRQSRFLYHSGSFSQPYILHARRLKQIIKYFRYFSLFFKFMSRWKTIGRDNIQRQEQIRAY